MSLYEKVVEFVDEAFKEKKAHFERAVFWMEKFVPNYSESHEIAAYAHDIERAFRDDSIEHGAYNGEFYIKYHPEKGAEIIGDFLSEQGVDRQSIEHVKHLIRKHEVGGDAEQNALMDADSVSFFETNAEMFVKKKAPVEGYQKIKDKFDWMFNRISSDERKEFARANYEKWISELEKEI